jgi:hypothetical protein
MANTNRHLIIATPATPGATNLPVRDEVEPNPRQVHSGGRGADAEKIVRALVATYLRPRTDISSCFHCW